MAATDHIHHHLWLALSFSRCVFVFWTCTCVLMGVLTTVCFVAAQLAVLYSIAEDSVVGARVLSWHGRGEIYFLAVVILVVRR